MIEPGKQDSTNIELLERNLYLKTLQIKSLLYITQSINNNVSAEELFGIYQSTLNWELQIKKMALFFKMDEEWKCVSNLEVNQDDFPDNLSPILLKYERMANIDEDETTFLNQFDIIVPVFHKQYPIAYTLIGDLDKNDNTYEKIQFVTTLTNIIAVAIENKRLFKKQLEQERLKREVELAGEVQTMLIPKELPSNEHWEFDGIYKPHSGVGGDYFDLIKLNEQELIFCIADISGKGVPAAILMANFQANLQVLVRKHINSSTFIRLLNRTVMRITKGDKFITFFIGKYNRETKKLVYINAGHNPPILLQNGEMTLLEKGCTILGSFDKLGKVEVGEIEFDSEAMIVCYTDGLTDLANSSGEYFDIEKLQLFIEEFNHLSPAVFNKQLLKKIEAFKEDTDYPDDVAVLTTKLNKTSGVVETVGNQKNDL